MSELASCECTRESNGCLCPSHGRWAWMSVCPGSWLQLGWPWLWESEAWIIEWNSSQSLSLFLSSSSLPAASTASITIFQINKYVPDVLDTYHMKNTLEWTVNKNYVLLSPKDLKSYLLTLIPPNKMLTGNCFSIYWVYAKLYVNEWKTSLSL